MTWRSLTTIPHPSMLGERGSEIYPAANLLGQIHRKNLITTAISPGITRAPRRGEHLVQWGRGRGRGCVSVAT